jgi:hypothetical protein
MPAHHQNALKVEIHNGVTFCLLPSLQNLFLFAALTRTRQNFAEHHIIVDSFEEPCFPNPN